MNRKQKLVLIIGLVLFVTFGLFPTWEYQFDLKYNDVHLIETGASTKKFHFILTPPSSIQHFPTLFPNSVEDYISSSLISKASTNYSVDLDRLLIIWIIIAVLTSILYTTLADNRNTI